MYGNYLIRNQYSYCFRMKVPADLQGVIGRKELRYSLRTTYLTPAKCKAGFLVVLIHRLFIDLRRRKGKLADLSEEKIQELVKQYIKDSVEDFDKRLTC